MADELAGERRARAWLAGVGGSGTREELRQVWAVRGALQAVVGDERPATARVVAAAGRRYIHPYG